MSRSRRAVLLSAPSLLVGLAGCAGDEGNAPTETRTTSAGSTTTEAETPTETATATPTETATPSPTETSTGQSVRIGAFSNYFDPIRQSVSVGTTVVWENNSSGTYDSHTVTSTQFHETAVDWSFDEEFSGGETLSYTFEEAGVYEYYCSIHGETSMCGAVLVGDVSLEQDLPCE